MSGGAPLRARGSVCARRPPDRNPRVTARGRHHRRSRTGHCAAGEDGCAARRRTARSRKVAHHRQGPRRREGDHRPDACGPGLGRRRHARAHRRQGIAQQSPHGRAEGRGEADPVREESEGGRPGLRGDRQDRYAELRPHAPREARVEGRRPRPSASAARTLENEAGVESETLQRFLARNAGVAEGRLTAMGERAMRAAFGNTVLVVDEGSLVSTV